MIIAVDFDGTCVTHEYPLIGREVEYCIDVLKKLISSGHKIILYTMRSDKELLEAAKWLMNNGIDLWGINENPEQSKWTNSRKVYANLYIDDAALGCPLLFDEFSDRHYVNWKEVERYLYKNGVLIHKPHFT